MTPEAHRQYTHSEVCAIGEKIVLAMRTHIRNIRTADMYLLADETANVGWETIKRELEG